MAYTGHGHHIPGSVDSGTPPKQVARCGGPKLCTQCAKDASKALHPAGKQHPLFHGYDHPQVHAFMKHFDDDNLPPYLARMVSPICDAARFVDWEMDDGTDKIEILNYLLKAKEAIARCTRI